MSHNPPNLDRALDNARNRQQEAENKAIREKRLKLVEAIKIIAEDGSKARDLIETAVAIGELETWQVEEAEAQLESLLPER